LAQPRRATKVDCQRGVAPVGQPLGLGIVSPAIAGPRTAMHAEDQGKVRSFQAEGKGQVAYEFETVARWNGNSFHRCQLVLANVRMSFEKVCQTLAAAVIEIVVVRPRVGGERNGPALPIAVMTDDCGLAVAGV